MKFKFVMVILFVFSTSFSEEKVRENYSELSVEGPTTVEYNIPSIDRDQNNINDNSYRFNLTPNFTVWPMKEDKRWGKSGITVAYVGVYDFYFGTKESGPVISRKQNPFLYIFTEHLTYTEYSAKGAIGVGHESNGQFISSKQSHEYFEKSFNDEVHGVDGSGSKPKYSQYNLEDWASMGWNYYYTEIGLKKNKVIGTNASLMFKIHLRWFFTHGTIDPRNQILEENIFYDDELINKTSIRDYDGFRYSLEWKGDSRHYNVLRSNYLVYDPSISIGVRHGYVSSSFNPTIWGRIYFKLLGTLPVFYKYTNGYGRDISNYPYRFSSHALGIELGGF